MPSHAVPKYSTTTRLHTTTSHVNSRMLPSVTRMKCVSTETPREDSDRSACATHHEQKLQLKEQKTLTETSQEVTGSAEACLSLARVAFKLCVVVTWSAYVQQGTGVQLLTVEQECLSLGTDVKHSEVQNLSSLPNDKQTKPQFTTCETQPRHSEHDAIVQPIVVQTGGRMIPL